MMHFIVTNFLHFKAMIGFPWGYMLLYLYQILYFNRWAVMKKKNPNRDIWISNDFISENREIDKGLERERERKRSKLKQRKLILRIEMLSQNNILFKGGCKKRISNDNKGMSNLTCFTISFLIYFSFRSPSNYLIK